MLRSSDGVGEILVDEATIRAEVARLGAQISADYAGRQPHLIGVLKGAAVFIADLARALTVPATMDFISIVPYGQEVTSSGVVRIRKDLDDPIEGKDGIVGGGVPPRAPSRSRPPCSRSMRITRSLTTRPASSSGRIASNLLAPSVMMSSMTTICSPGSWSPSIRFLVP